MDLFASLASGIALYENEKPVAWSGLAFLCRDLLSRHEMLVKMKVESNCESNSLSEWVREGGREVPRSPKFGCCRKSVIFRIPQQKWGFHLSRGQPPPARVNCPLLVFTFIDVRWVWVTCLLPITLTTALRHNHSSSWDASQISLTIAQVKYLWRHVRQLTRLLSELLLLLPPVWRRIKHGSDEVHLPLMLSCFHVSPPLSPK